MTPEAKKIISAVARQDMETNRFGKTTHEELDALLAAIGWGGQKRDPSKVGVCGRLLTINETCDLFKVSRVMLNKLTKSGKIKHVSLSGSKKSIRYRSSDIEEFLKENTI